MRNDLRIRREAAGHPGGGSSRSSSAGVCCRHHEGDRGRGWDLSQPAIYHYVGAKADLLREIALHVDREMSAALDIGLASADDPEGQLRGVIHAFTAAVVRDRRAFAVFWQELHSLEPDVREKIAADERDFVGKVGKLITALQKSGRMPAGPPVVLARGGPEHAELDVPLVPPGRGAEC